MKTCIGDAVIVGLNHENCVALETAYLMRDTLEEEKDVNDLLSAAVSSGDVYKWSHAMTGATRIGLTGPVVDQARNKSEALGRRSETPDRVAVASSSDMLDDIGAASEEKRLRKWFKRFPSRSCSSSEVISSWR